MPGQADLGVVRGPWGPPYDARAVGENYLSFDSGLHSGVVDFVALAFDAIVFNQRRTFGLTPQRDT